jgi:20S proteasome alpha/beta subunit
MLSVANVFHHFQSRPFGAALLLAGIDESGPHLLHIDPTGTFTEYYAKAVGMCGASMLAWFCLLCWQ